VIRIVRGHRQVSRTVRFGAIRPGGRVVLKVRLLRPLGPDALIRAVGLSIRNDNLHSITSLRAGL
jgi:hypothetical protein